MANVPALNPGDDLAELSVTRISIEVSWPATLVVNSTSSPPPGMQSGASTNPEVVPASGPAMVRQMPGWAQPPPPAELLLDAPPHGPQAPNRTSATATIAQRPMLGACGGMN